MKPLPSTVILNLLLVVGCTTQTKDENAPGPNSEAIAICTSGDSDTDDHDKLRKVIRDCTMALRDEQHDKRTRADILTTRGVALRNVGALDASLADLDAAVRLGPDSGNVRRMRAWTLYGMGRYTAAELEYGRALAVDDHWQAFLSRCVVRMDMSKFDAALDDCKTALERDRNIDALYFTAWLYNERGEPERAIPLLEEARGSSDLTARIFSELAHSYLAAGDNDAALAALEDGLAAFPEDQELKDLLSEI